MHLFSEELSGHVLWKLVRQVGVLWDAFGGCTGNDWKQGGCCWNGFGEEWAGRVTVGARGTGGAEWGDQRGQFNPTWGPMADSEQGRGWGQDAPKLLSWPTEQKEVLCIEIIHRWICAHTHNCKIPVSCSLDTYICWQMWLRGAEKAGTGSSDQAGFLKWTRGARFWKDL